ncbi:hypothetical protein, partial [Deinococcus aerophilus]|uniref:hypothetical protein n=1 Tax=Deinococcus aerophilus TaxID=522488 RepID=UPI00166AB107
MRLKFVSPLLAAALLSVATAVSPAPAQVAVNATVNDACEITGVADIVITEYRAADLAPAKGFGAVSVRCNLDTTPFLGYWDDTQWNTDGTVDLMNGPSALKVMLESDIEPNFIGSDSLNGSQYSYNIMASAA